MRPNLPTGTVTFLFTDVEGSTRLLHSLGAEAYAAALAEHRRVIREACSAEGGVEVDTQGDAFFFAFPSAPRAITAASTFREALESGPIRVRVGLHTGAPLLTDEGYVGDDVHLGARVAGAGHGGQVVISAATAALVECELKDLGEHRLKDIAKAVTIFQLGGASFPPLKTISNTNLPRPASSFVGREAELGEVLRRIERGARLVTLTGPGGSGKTRLALEAAVTLVPDYKAGVFWVGLASLRTPALVTETIAQVLGAKHGLPEHIGERELLVLLDNLEQVVEAAPELSALLSVCPNLTFLCTSRELLRIRGEVEYPVPPLAEPEAVSLFCERSQLQRSDEVAELCARLDSLPLAVELAAARTKALTPAQILERISQRLDLLRGGRDADPRQQTLRATIEWSHDLLSDGEQALFARHSVFSGGCTLEAAEEVADADLDTLQSLVEKSLLRFTNERYWMLETIREYAGERLEESSEANERRRQHAHHYMSLALRAEPHLDGTREQSAWLDRIEVESANLREALPFLASGDPGGLLRLAAALWRFWQMHSHFSEGRRWLQRALELNPEPTFERRVALEGAGYMAYVQGDFAEMRSFVEDQLAVAEHLKDGPSIAQSLHLLAHLEGAEGNRERSIQLYKQSLTYDHPRRGDSLYALGHLALLEGDYERAIAWFEQAQVANRARGDDWALSGDLVGLGYALHGQGRDEEACRVLKQGLQLAVPLGEKQQLAKCLDALAAAIAAQEPELAASFLGASEALREEIGVPAGTLAGHWNPRTREVLRLRLSEGALQLNVERGRSMALDEVLERALGHAARSSS
jgi:predicted ATPase